MQRIDNLFKGENDIIGGEAATIQKSTKNVAATSDSERSKDLLPFEMPKALIIIIYSFTRFFYFEPSHKNTS